MELPRSRKALAQARRAHDEMVAAWDSDNDFDYRFVICMALLTRVGTTIEDEAKGNQQKGFPSWWKQAAVLDNIRSRANVLLSAATVAVSFVVSVGLLTKDTKPLPGWADVLLVSILVAIGFCAFGILWPREWSFSIGPQITIEDYIEGSGPEAQNVNIMYRKLALYSWARWEANDAELAKLFLLFEIAVALLLVGVVTLTIGLALR